jgi:hypothetical protein
MFLQFLRRVANLLVGFPDIEFGFGTRVRSLPDALKIATPKKRLPGAGGGFLTSYFSKYSIYYFSPPLFEHCIESVVPGSMVDSGSKGRTVE